VLQNLTATPNPLGLKSLDIRYQYYRKGLRQEYIDLGRSRTQALALASSYLHYSCSIQVYARLITFGPNKPFGRPSNELAGDSPFIAIIAFFSMDWRIGFVVGR
jgi:hypothetical protein